MFRSTGLVSCNAGRFDLMAPAALSLELSIIIFMALVRRVAFGLAEIESKSTYAFL